MVELFASVGNELESIEPLPNGKAMINKTLIGLLSLIVVTAVYAAKPPVFATSEGAIKGYDPVAYFTEGKPVKGSDQYTFEWMGATYKFANAENRALFEADADKYAPQYGGYCAYAVSQGYTASTVPEAFSIVEGKLYLNYSLLVREQWSRNILDRIAAGNKNWPQVLN